MDINVIYSIILAILGSAGLWKVIEIVAQKGLKSQQNIYTESTAIRKELREDVARLQEQAADLNNKLISASKENLALQNEVHALRLENAEFRKENAELKSEMEGLRTLLERLAKQNAGRGTRTKRNNSEDGGQ